MFHRFGRDFRHCVRHELMGRHHGFGRHGFGRFGFGLEDGFGAGFPMGRKLSSDDLQLLVLSLLADKPSYGYEIMKAIEALSYGFYAPSAGMVYPALSYLSDVGYATVSIEGAKKSYAITDAGRAYLDEHRDTAQAMRSQLAKIGEKVARMRRFFSGGEGSERSDGRDGSRAMPDDGRWQGMDEARGRRHRRDERPGRPDVWDLPDEAAAGNVAEDLLRERHRLRVALAQIMNASRDEQLRVAEILRRAIREIVGE